MYITEITNASNPVLLGHRYTASAAQRVRVAGNYAYTLCAGGRLEIINIQNPGNPTLTGTFSSTNEWVDVDVRSNVVVLASPNGRVAVLNVSNPAAPVVQTNLTVPNGAWGVRLAGANAYVRNGVGELVVLPIASLGATAPQLIAPVAPKQAAVGQAVVLSVLAAGTTPMTFQWYRNNLPLADTTRYSGTTNAWLTITTAEAADSGVYSVTIANALGALVSSNVLTVVTPGTPVWRGAFQPGGSAEGVDVNNAIVYVAAGTNGLQIFNAISPRFSYQTGGYADGGFAAGIRVSDAYAHLAGGTNGLQVFDAAEYWGESQLLAATNTPGTTRAVYLANGLAYVADGESGLEVYQLNGAAEPLWLGAYDTPGYAWNVNVIGGLAYVADGTNGVEILSVTNPAAITRLGGYNTPGDARNVKVTGTTAYVADGPGGLLILNVENPAAPLVLGNHPVAPVLDLELAVGLAVLALDTNGIEVIDVTSPAAILSVGHHLVAPARSLRLEGPLVYIAAGTNGVQIVELLGAPVVYPTVLITPGEFISLPGGPGLFLASAQGGKPFTYQWYKDDQPLLSTTNLHGVGTAALSFDSLTLADSGKYSVVVHNGWNLAARAEATLHVVPVGTPVFRSGYFNEGDSLNTHVVGQIAFVASRLDGLQAIDCRDPLNPVLVGQTATLGLAQDVCIKGRYAFVAAWDAGLEIFDILDPTNLVRVGQCNTPGFAHAVRLTGHYAHVADREGGYAIIDVRQPTHPVIAGRAITGGFAEGVAVAGSQAYLAASDAGLEVFDTSNPLAPTRVAQLDTPGNAEAVTVSGTRAYISDYHRGLCIADVTDPQTPTVLGRLETLGDAFHVQVISNRAYIAEGIGKVELADLSDPTSPTHISTSLAGASVRSLQIIGRHAFLVDRAEGFVVAELLGLPAQAPTIVDFASSTTNGVGDELVLSVAAEATPPLGYVWYRNGIPLAQASNISGVTEPHLHFPSLALTNAGNYTVVITNAQGSVTSAVAQVTVNPLGTPIVRGSLDTPGFANAAAVFGNIAYIADGSGGLRLVNLSNLDNLGSLGTYVPTGAVLAVSLQTNLLYLALGTNGVTILDVSQPTQPSFVGAFDTPGAALNLAVTNQRVFVADGAAGLQIWSVTNPALPIMLGHLPTTGHTRDVQVAGDLAFLAEGTGGLRIATVTNPAAPVAIGSYPGPGQANAVRLQGSRAYVAAGSAGLLMFDVQDPTMPVLLGTYPTTNATALDVVGDFVVLADGPNGYLFLNVSNPANVNLLGVVTSSGVASGAIVLGNQAFLSTGTAGLRVVELFGVAPRPPAFLTQPASISVLSGGIAHFGATPVGTPALLYRWYHNDQPVFDGGHISGAATTFLTVSNVAFADGGNYQLRVLGPAGVTNSSVAKLTFIGPLQAQLNAATNGTVISLPAGTYTENLVLDREVTLVGSWWNKPVLSGGQVGPAVQVLPGATVILRGIAVRHGVSTELGGGIYNEGALTLEHCLLADNTAASGGGIGNLGSLRIFQSVISNNTATVSGGGFYNGPQAAAFITNSLFIANEADSGGGVCNYGTNILTGVLLAYNSALGSLGTGGGLRQSSGFSQLLNSTLSGNSAAAWASHSGTARGGGARVEGGRLDFVFATVANNTAAAAFGGVSVAAAAEVHARNSVFAGNTAPITPDFGGTLRSEGGNLVQQTSVALTVTGITIGNQLDVNAQLGPLRDNGGPTWTHAPTADSPVIDAGISPGPATDARGLARPFDLPWRDNTPTSWDLGAFEYVDPALYLIMSNRIATGFTLAWPTNAVLQRSAFPETGWVDQTNVSPLFVATATTQSFYRLYAPYIPYVLKTNNETNHGFDLSWPDFGILEHGPTTTGPWEALTGLSPFHVTIVSDQNEFFRLRVVEH
ncbi:MAG: immunoglobulin domain-containing protein [Verrucomicrobiota bacterium]